MKLTSKEISFLANMFPQNNQLSLFANISVPLDGSEQKSLEQKEIYHKGRLSDAARAMLTIVAEPQRCTRLVLKDSFALIEKYAYRVNDQIMLAENDDGEMVIGAAKSFEKTFLELAEFVGMSNLKTVALEVFLPNDEALTLLAMIDIQRKNALLSYLGNKPALAISFTEIRQQLDEPKPNSLVRMLVNNYNYSVPTIENTKSLLDQLTTKDIVTFDGGYVLESEYAALASNFLIIHNLVMLETFNLNAKNELASAGVLCVCAGIKDILSFIFTSEGMEIATITGAQLLKMMENFLSCPDLGAD